MKKLQELFVPYELAVKLKDKGFINESFAIYNGIKDFSFFKTSNEVLISKDSDSISAPLYQQAIDWFRINHTIDIVHVTPNGYNKMGWKVQTYNISKDSYFFESAINSIYTKDTERKYYEALNKAIEKALNLI